MLVKMNEIRNDQCVAKTPIENAKINAPKRRPPRRNPWGNSSYADLITQAIETSPDKKLTLSQIYDWMILHVPYFKNQGTCNSSAGWKNSIRHNLSLHKKFSKIKNETTNAKSSWWTVNKVDDCERTTRRKKVYRRKKYINTFQQKINLNKQIRKISVNNDIFSTAYKSDSKNPKWSDNIELNLSRLISDFPYRNWQTYCPCAAETDSFPNIQTGNEVYSSFYSKNPLFSAPINTKDTLYDHINESVDNRFSTYYYPIQHSQDLNVFGNDVHKYCNPRQAHEKENIQIDSSLTFTIEENTCFNISRECFKSPHHLSGSCLNSFNSSKKLKTIRYGSDKSDGCYLDQNTLFPSFTESSQIVHVHPISTEYSHEVTCSDELQNHQEDSLFLVEKDIDKNELTGKRLFANTSVEQIFQSAIASISKKNYSSNSENSDVKETLIFGDKAQTNLIIGKGIESKTIDENEKENHADKEEYICFESAHNNSYLIDSHSKEVTMVSSSTTKSKAYTFYDETHVKYLLSSKEPFSRCLEFVLKAINITECNRIFFPVKVILRKKVSTDNFAILSKENSTTFRNEFSTDHYTAILQPTNRVGRMSRSFPSCDSININSPEELPTLYNKNDMIIHFLLLNTANNVLWIFLILSNSTDFVEHIRVRLNNECEAFSPKRMLCYITEFLIFVSHLYYHSVTAKANILQKKTRNEKTYFPGQFNIIDSYFEHLNKNVTAFYCDMIMSSEKMSKFTFPPNIIDFLLTYVDDKDRRKTGAFLTVAGTWFKDLNLMSITNLKQYCSLSLLPEQPAHSIKQVGIKDSFCLFGEQEQSVTNIIHESNSCISPLDKGSNVSMGHTAIPEIWTIDFIRKLNSFQQSGERINHDLKSDVLLNYSEKGIQSENCEMRNKCIGESNEEGILENEEAKLHINSSEHNGSSNYHPADMYDIEMHFDSQMCDECENFSIPDDDLVETAHDKNDYEMYLQHINGKNNRIL